MAAVDDPKTLGRTRLSFANVAEIDEFVATLEKFERGDLTSDQWRAYRLVRGTYGQRQSDVQMLRVKIPQGILSAAQLEALAEVGESYSRGFGHITTRQNFQFHFLQLHDVEPVMRRLAQTGLTTREACGNSVRNITACPYAGVAGDELFDVTPYAEALTRYLLRHPLSSSLPRKFKIAFEGCAEDHALTAINDLGFRAALNSSAERGFRVTAGGGTSILCTSGRVLHEFLPAGELFNLAESILRVFHRLGDREHKQRNRMKFLIKQLGWEQWRETVERAREAFIAEGGAALPFDPQSPPIEEALSGPRLPSVSTAEISEQAASSETKGPGILPRVEPMLAPSGGKFEHWRDTNARPQKQPGYWIATATVPLGDLTSQQMRVIAKLALSLADGTVRVTPEQNLLFRWVREAGLSSLYGGLAAAGLWLPDAGTIADVTSCPGAESCRLAVTQSRGLGRLIGDQLRLRPELVEAARDVKIKISGCPNGCGQHHVADIGFQGSVRRLGGKALPQYFLTIGGGVDGTGAHFGRLVGKIPARRIPDAVERLILLYQSERSPNETAGEFLRRVDLPRAKACVENLEALSLEDATPEDYVDLGEQAEFVPDTQQGECAA